MSIFSYIRQQRHEYESETIPVVEGYEHSQKEVIERATKYWASQYDGDDDDPILGKLPFFNIIIGKVEKEAEATDFDTKDIEVRPKRNDRMSRFKNMIATKAIREYMERYGFAKFLNDLTHTRALFGGVVVKDTEDGPRVVPWHNLVTDQADLMSGVVIERHYYTPAELKKKDGKWENVDEAIEKAAEFKFTELDNTGLRQETQGHYIEVFELHGQVPEDLVDEDGDPHTYKQMMIVVAGADWVKTDDDGNQSEEGLILYQSEEKESPYKYNARNAIPGRALGVGIAESMFHAQKYFNFTISEQMRTMSIAGKIFYDTDNPEVPSNLLTKLDHGTVIKRKSEHAPLQQVSNVPQSLPAYDNIRAEIGELVRDITGAHGSVTGEETKSGTPFRLAALQNVEGHSRYEQEREEIGEFVEDIIRDWVMPRAIKWLTSEDELYTHFEATELAELDEIIITKKINRFVVDKSLAGEVVEPDALQKQVEKVRKELRRGGTKRLVKDVKKHMKDIDGDVRISTTAEHLNKQAWFESRANVLQLLAPDDPRRSALINRIMEEAGITEDELRLEEERMMRQQAQQQQPQSGEVEFSNQERRAPAEEVA